MAKHEGNQFDIQESIFIVAQQGLPFKPTVLATSNWFVPPPADMPGSDFLCEVTEFGQGCTDAADLAIAANNSTVSSGKKWLSERYLFRKLKETPSCVQSGTVFDAFVSQKSNTTVGKFDDIESAIAALFEINETTKQAIQGNYNDLEAKQASLLSIEIQLATATGQDYANLLASRSALLVDIDQLTKNNAVLMEGIRAQRVANSMAILATNNAIASPQIYEQNEKAYNEVYLATIATGLGSFTIGQIQTLTDIANQCPAEGGNAVFKARSLLEVATDANVLFDDDICSPALLMKNGAGNVSFNNIPLGVEMFPNPGKDLLNLTWHEFSGSEGTAMLKDMMGRTVLTEALDLKSGSTTLDMGMLLPGIYSCEIQVDGKLVFAEKYVLIK